VHSGLPGQQTDLPHGAGTPSQVQKSEVFLDVSPPRPQMLLENSINAYARHVSRFTLTLQTKTCPYAFI